VDGPDAPAKSASRPPYSARVTARKAECVYVYVKFVSVIEFTETRSDHVRCRSIFSDWKCEIIYVMRVFLICRGMLIWVSFEEFVVFVNNQILCLST
jgi:hypothetical protein